MTTTTSKIISRMYHFRSTNKNVLIIHRSSSSLPSVTSSASAAATCLLRMQRKQLLFATNEILSRPFVVQQEMTQMRAYHVNNNAYVNDYSQHHQQLQQQQDELMRTAILYYEQQHQQQKPFLPKNAQTIIIPMSMKKKNIKKKGHSSPPPPGGSSSSSSSSSDTTSDSSDDGDGSNNDDLDFDDESLELPSLTEIQNKMKQVIQTTVDQLSAIRDGGEPSPDIFDNVKVKVYGSDVANTLLVTLAQVSIDSATRVTLNCYDPSTAVDVCDAVRDAGLDFQPRNEGDGIIIVPIPRVSAETRMVRISFFCNPL